VNRIVSILPKGEGFSTRQFGAIALCVRDFTEYSRYGSETIVIGGHPEPGFEGISYRSPPRPKWYENRTRSYARGCVRILQDTKAELAEIHNRPNLVRLMRPHVSCKIALHLHNDPQEMKAARTVRERSRLLELCDGIYCVSSYIRNRFLEGLNETAKSKLHLVYNGIALPEHIPEKEKLIVFAGRITEGKGALLLAQALRIALPQLPDWRAVFIGSRRNEASAILTPHEKDTAETLQPLDAQAQLLGFLPHPETLAYFGRGAIAVIPSLWQEPFGRTAIEAMAYGCAVISSGTGGLYEVTGNAALTLTNITSQALAAAILRLTQDKEECATLQSLARTRAAFFSIANSAMALDTARDIILKENFRDA